MEELEIILKKGWTAAVVESALNSVDTSRIGSVSLICGEHWLPEGDWDGLAALLAAWPGIRQFSVRSGYGLAGGTVEVPEAVIELCRSTDTSFRVEFLLEDGVDVPAYFVGQNGPLRRCVEASLSLQSGGQKVRWLIPLTATLVYRLEGLVSLAFDTGVEPVLFLPGLLGNTEPLASDDLLFARDFIKYRILGEENHRLTQRDAGYYEDLLLALGEQAIQSGGSERYVLEAAPQRKEAESLELTVAPDHPLRTRGLAHFLDRDSEPSRPGKINNLLADVADVAIGGLRAHLQATLAGFGGKSTGAEPKMANVLLIGAYGGEHIGDLAILGGVLRRIHARHGTSTAVLLSQRPDHTRHLMPMLETPVDLEVKEYTFANIRDALSGADGVVYAGGPLTDIPKQLVRHLYAASLARRAGKPFVVEGIGPGVFKRKPSFVTARRLLGLADRISIRVRDDADRDVIRGLPIDIGQDPAFDYLETRKDELTRLRGGEQNQIDALLANTKGRLIVGLNVRPIGDFFTPDAPGRDRVAYTREVEQNFERQFAAGLQDFAGKSESDPCFVFFPMNAIQFGMSDLRSAYRIMAHLEPGIDFRVWQADASLDGVVALIRRLDIVVSMRFHGAIFALSQGCPVLGIDYRIGKRDKVASVLSDAGQIENCCRIDQLTAEWLCSKLTALSE